MNNPIYIAGSALVIVVLSGLWLSHRGRPLSTLLLTIHKLIAVGILVYLTITLYRMHQASPLTTLIIALGCVTLVFFLGLIATGGFLSAARPMPAFVLRIHQILPGLVVIATGATLYLAFIAGN